MSDNKNKGDKVRPEVQWTAEDRARHQAIRDMFRDWHPSPEELIASGEAANFDLQGEPRELRPFVEEIKRAREAAELTLAEVSRRCGIDQPALFPPGKTGLTRTRRSTRSGVTLPQSGSAWFYPPKRSATRGQRRARRSGSGWRERGRLPHSFAVMR